MSSWDSQCAETMSSSSEKWLLIGPTCGAVGGAGLHTIPELLLIFQGVGDLEFHVSSIVDHDQSLIQRNAAHSLTLLRVGRGHGYTCGKV